MKRTGMLNKNCTTHAIIQYCSVQDTLHIPPEHRRFRRIHGLQPPLHPQQIIGWVLLIIVFTGTFTVLLTTLPLPDLRFVLLLLFATLLLLHVSAHLTVLLLDPADPEVRARPTGEVVPEFDRTKHQHVIENDRCHLCNITTRGQRTKHCSICNKCVPHFDHHCKWLNNCIGGRNYPAFLVCLISTLITALSIAVLAFSDLVLINIHSFVVDNERCTNNSNSANMNNTISPSLPIPGTGLLILITIVGILSTVAAVLLIHLCFFHGYITYLGLTTYEYVRSKRDRSIIRSRTTSSSDLCTASHCTNNNNENIDQMINTRGLYSRCENGPFRISAGAIATTDVFVCSTHEEIRGDDTMTNDKNVCTRMLSSKKGSRNFHLCFSYDTRTTETSIEVSSSRMTDIMESRNHKESPDTKSSSTPSPVSCCFSIMNHHSEGRHDRNGRGRRIGEHRSQIAKRSCGTMKRIQIFLQTRLRKTSKQKSATLSTVGRHCSKVILQAKSSPDVASTITEHQDQLVETLTTELRMIPHNPRPPARLSALDLLHVTHNGGVSSNSRNISVLVPSSIKSKRNQAHLCTRRNANLSKKRPRFKIDSHIVTQTAQLSPIPESEFSKPATPRSPSRSNFVFPSLREEH